MTDEENKEGADAAQSDSTTGSEGATERVKLTKTELTEAQLLEARRAIKRARAKVGEAIGELVGVPESLQIETLEDLGDQLAVAAARIEG